MSLVEVFANIIKLVDFFPQALEQNNKQLLYMTTINCHKQLHFKPSTLIPIKTGETIGEPQIHPNSSPQ